MVDIRQHITQQSGPSKYAAGQLVPKMSKNNVLELSFVNLSDDEDNDTEEAFNKERKSMCIQDFDKFKQQFNLQEIIDKLVIKREFFIPSKAMDINQFYIFDKVFTDYKVINQFHQELGEGAYGKVYRARHKKSGMNISKDLNL